LSIVWYSNFLIPQPLGFAQLECPLYGVHFSEKGNDLTNTLKIQRLPQLFNDYNGMEARKPSKTHKTPLQNCSAAGFTYALKQPKSLISSGFRA